ncbi:MAG: thioesterase domain-containing protein, partial [Bacteroidota bacterium]
GRTQPLYSFIAPGSDGHTEHCLKSIEAMAETYIEAMQTVDPEGPYYLGGYSMGGLVAYEMALQLERKGFKTAQLIIFDAMAPWYDQTRMEYTEEKYDQELLKLAEEILNFFGKEMLLKLSDIEGKSKEEKLNTALRMINESTDMEASVSQLRAYMELGMDSILLENNYCPKKVKLDQVPILILQPVADVTAKPDTLGWEEFTTGALTNIPLQGGDHEDFMSQPHVKNVAQALQQHLLNDL